MLSCRDEMSSVLAVTNAVASKLDAIEAYPELASMPVDQLEICADAFLVKIIESITTAIDDRGEVFIINNDPTGLAGFLFEEGIPVPLPALVAIAQDIVEQLQMKVLVTAYLPGGQRLYYAKMDVSLL